MAKKVQFDDGLIRLDINGNGILAFNPSDFNVYQRVYALTRELPELEKQYSREVEESETEFERVGKELDRAREIDLAVKKKLSHAFGDKNDFDVLLDGVNVMAFGGNGERIITNLLNALMPYIEEGISKIADSEIETAKKNREQRRAALKKT